MRGSKGRRKSKGKHGKLVTVLVFSSEQRAQTTDSLTTDRCCCRCTQGCCPELPLRGSPHYNALVFESRHDGLHFSEAIKVSLEIFFPI